MFTFFNKNSKEESSSESDCESLYEESEDNEILEKELCIFHTQNNVIYGRLPMESFVNNVTCWAFNRPLNKKRVRELSAGILKTRFVHGIFTLVFFDGEYYLIDGQHRHQALINAWEKDSSLDVAVIVCIYNVDSEEKIIDLFKIVNNTNPLDPKETPNIVIINTVKKLAGDFKPAIRLKEDRTVYPYLLASDMQNKLRNIVNSDLSVDKLYSTVRKINHTYSKLKPVRIPGVRAKLTKTAVDKARKSGFYLGLDEKWSWVEEAEDIIEFKT